MRKILTSVLGVAGLLAVVLALASSPASAAKEVVTFATGTGDASPVGTYTVSWETQGGCDPGSGTSGASGSASATVTGATPTATTGDDQEIGVVTDNICNYDYEYSYVTGAGAACALTDDGDAGGDLEVGAACTTPVKVVVTIEAAGVNVGDCIADVSTEDDAADDDCDLDGDVDTGTDRRQRHE